MLASSAFLASAAGTLPLQSQILWKTLAAIEDTSASLKCWHTLSGVSGADSLPASNQKVLDSIIVNRLYSTPKPLNIIDQDFLPPEQLTAAAGSMPSQCRHVVSD